jgi:drug/metabolite transporter (DMT)-like permease
MGCLTKNSAVRRFIFRITTANVAYIGLTVSIALCFYKFRPHGPIAFFLAALPAVAILGVIASMGLYLVEEKDEFQRYLMTQILLWGLGGVLMFTSVWGLLETFTRIRHFNPSWTFSLFWICVGISTPFLLRKYR